MMPVMPMMPSMDSMVDPMMMMMLQPPSNPITHISGISNTSDGQTIESSVIDPSMIELTRPNGPSADDAAHDNGAVVYAEPIHVRLVRGPRSGGGKNNHAKLNHNVRLQNDSK